MERALFTYRSMTLSGRDTPPELTDLAGRVTAAWDTWIISPNKYTDTLSVLPDSIVDVENSLTVYDRSPEACRQASEVYQLARAVLKHAGRIDLVPFVCDRAMRCAEEIEDSLLIGAATWYVGQAALSNDMPHTALDIAMLTAEKFEQLLRLLEWMRGRAHRVSWSRRVRRQPWSCCRSRR